MTIPKEFRDQLGLEESDVAKVKIEGDNLVIQSRKVAQYAEYRKFSKAQIDEFIKEDQLSQPLATEVQKRWTNKMK